MTSPSEPSVHMDLDIEQTKTVVLALQGRHEALFREWGLNRRTNPARAAALRIEADRAWEVSIMAHAALQRSLELPVDTGLIVP